MTKIHSHINDLETPITVKNLLNQFLLDFENQVSENWKREVVNKNSEYHRKILLQQGRCDFDKPMNGLTSEELICLYNYYYFAMHFQSSFWLYNYIWNSGFAVMLVINKDPIFIDLGCGTLASSIAFAQTINQRININLFEEKPMLNETKIQINEIFRLADTRTNLSEQECIIVKYSDEHSVFSTFKDLSQQGATYILADISEKVLDFIYKFVDENNHYGSRNQFIWKTVLMEDGYWSGNFLFDNFHLFNGFTNSEEYKPLYYDTINDYINYCKSDWKDEPVKKSKSIFTILKNKPDSSIIINCSYLFASHSINIDEVASFVNSIAENHNQNICLIYQNPDNATLNSNWESFKLKVSLKSIAKGVAPIKHYGNSKVRYEILFKSKFGTLAT